MSLVLTQEAKDKGMTQENFDLLNTVILELNKIGINYCGIACHGHPCVYFKNGLVLSTASGAISVTRRKSGIRTSFIEEAVGYIQQKLR